MKLSRVSIFGENATKTSKSNLLLVVVLVLKSTALYYPTFEQLGPAKDL